LYFLSDRLAFLTGQAEIELACRQLTEAYEEKTSKEERNLLIYPIYSTLDSHAQTSIFKETPKGKRKIVIATNIAQTSITIPGIRFVIDCGFVKQKMFDPKTGMDALMVVPISKSAATQRAGRAGRTDTGKVFRLYSREAFTSMPEDTTPEIQRSSLVGTVLGLKKIGIVDVLSFDLIDPPDPELVKAAERQLYLLGALDDEWKLTPLGDQMSHFPIAPHLSRVLIAAASESPSVASAVCDIVSLLSSEDVFVSPRSKKKQEDAEKVHASFHHHLGDHLTLLNVYYQWVCSGRSKSWASDRYFKLRSLSSAYDVSKQLRTILSSIRIPIPEPEKRPSVDQTDVMEVLKCFCTSFYLHVARKHAQRPFYFPYAMSKLAHLHQTSEGIVPLFLQPSCAIREQEHEWIIYHDVQYTGRPFMRCASAIRYEWVQETIDRYAAMPQLQGSSMVDHTLENIAEEPVTSLPRVSSSEFETVHEVIDELHHSETPIPDSKKRPASEFDRESKAKAARERYLSRKKK
jgi:HrpA-like RNA helicase